MLKRSIASLILLYRLIKSRSNGKFAMADLLATDDLTILLGLIAVTVFLLQNLYRPQPLVHPILLGRQSDVARVRHKRESAVYRNYGTGMMGRLPARPDKEVHITADLLKTHPESTRTLWSTKISNAELQESITAVGTGLLRLAGLTPGESNVLLLLNDCIEFVQTDLALAAHSVPTFTLTSQTLLSPVLEAHPPSAIVTHARFLPHLLELIYDSGEHGHHTVVVVGEPDAKLIQSAQQQVKVIRWSDVLAEGGKGEKAVSPAPNEDTVFTMSFYEDEHGQLRGSQLTHENFTAGVAAVRILLPLSSAISPLDTIVSTHSLSTAYGRAIAYTALYEGTSFATTENAKLYRWGPEPLQSQRPPAADVNDLLTAHAYPIPAPTIVFATPDHLKSLCSAVFREAQKSVLLYAFAWRHKVAALSEGYLTRESLWDRLVFDSARARVLGEGAPALRGFIVSGGALEASALAPMRVTLSVPLVHAHTHPLVAGPVLASHPLDLQTFPTEEGEPDAAPAGPPSVNVEAKLAGVDDSAVEGGADPRGALLVQGPPVGRLAGAAEGEQGDSWRVLGETARVLPNGTFVLLPKKV